jgi:hypothetical protein
MISSNKKRGFILIYFAIISLIVSVTVIGVYSHMVQLNFLTSINRTDIMRAYYVAEAGLAEGFTRLENDIGGNFGPINYTVGTEARQGRYRGNVDIDRAINRCTITSTGTYGNTSRSLRLIVRGDQYSQWVYCSNTTRTPAGSTTVYSSGSIINGPAHCNEHFHIMDNPVFNGPVSQCGDAIHYWSGGPPKDNPKFNSGITYNAIAIDFTNDILGTISGAAGLTFNGTTDITLLENGQLSVRNTALNNLYSGSPVIYNKPANDIVYVGGSSSSLTLRGIVNGRLTIGCNKKIYIDNNIEYKTDPLEVPSSTDILGLVTGSQVSIKAISTIPDKMRFDGVIVATSDNGCFTYGDSYGYGPIKTSLTRLGALIEDKSGGLGVVDNNGNTVDGFRTVIDNYDLRLQDIAPPGFPLNTDVNGNIIYHRIRFSKK